MTLKTACPKPAPKAQKPRSKIKPKKRSKSEFARIYGSEERVRFVKRLPCVACGGTRAVDNAHIRNGGTGRKAGSGFIVPLCIFCHHEYHELGRASLEAAWNFDLKSAAAETERLWLASKVEK